MVQTILTGDRPTGPLHLGHLVGSLQNRVRLQHDYDQYILIADAQALTDNSENPQKVRDNLTEVTLDYLACGIDPKQSTIFVQSMVPEIAELTMYFMNLVTVSRLQRNPTIKEEIKLRGFQTQVPVGFFVYPISQAADIAVFQADLVPVGEDQRPMIEQAVEIIDKFNRVYQSNVLVKPRALIPDMGRLPGTDGANKMSKSLNNAIYLKDDSNTLRKKVMSMYTDPNHVHSSDPGSVEGNPVFTYLDVFDPNKGTLEEMKAHYHHGGLGDVKVKRHLFEVLDAFLEPIRAKRREYDLGDVMTILANGTERARNRASVTLSGVKNAMRINYFA